MDTRLAVQEYRTNQWMEQIRSCRSSAMTVKAWCAENEINLKSYYYWLRKIRAAAIEGQSTAPQFVRIGTEEAVFCQGTGIKLRVSGCELEFSENTSDVLIERTPRAIRNVW